MEKPSITNFLSRERREWQAVADQYKNLGLMQVHERITRAFEEALLHFSSHEDAQYLMYWLTIEKTSVSVPADEDVFRNTNE